MPYNQPAKRPTPPAPINYNYTRTPGPLSADQMIAQQQERMRMQSQQATPRDHMQYQQAAAFNAESMAKINMSPQMQMPRQGPAPAAGMGFGAMPQTPFRQYPQFGQQPGAPMVPSMPMTPGYPYDGMSVPNSPLMPKKKGFYGPDMGMDFTDEDFGNMYQLLSQQGAFSPESLQGY